MRCVAVTGAAGFVGRATCRMLLEWGAEVRALVRDASDAARLPLGVTVAPTGDLATATTLEAYLADCDTAIHLAARTTLPRLGGQRALFSNSASKLAVDSGAIDGFEVNPRMTEHVIRAAARAGVKRFVLVSSVKAVGERTFDSPMTPSSVPNPTESYGRSKLLSEEVARSLGSESGVEVIVVRPPMVYGPGAPGNFSALIALSRIAARIPLPFGGIGNRRSTLFVNNLAHALSVVACQPELTGETFYVSDGQPLSTPEIILCISSVMGRHARLFALAPATLLRFASLLGARAEVEKLCASLEVDDSAFRSLARWSPPYSFEQAIALTVNAGTELVSPRALA